jgi:predicted AAA+ superfamily ATPase
VTASNRERVQTALEVLGEGLAPFVDEQMRQQAPDRANWVDAVAASLLGPGRKVSLTDPQFQLKVLWDFWNPVFSKVLQRSDRNLVSILRDGRDRWAHNEAFNSDETYRTLDAVQALLAAVSAEKQAQIVKRSRDEVLRQRFDEEARKAVRPTPATSKGVTGLRPWREVIVPHRDVTSGSFVQAEFAANLWQVFQGEGSPEYLDPAEFFTRTYLTEGLSQLLRQAVLRLGSQGGAPVVDLQTTFGGGKTHSLLALHHLFSGIALHRLPQEVQELVKTAGVSELPAVRQAVIVGVEIAPATPSSKPDGTVVNTLWGEIAWQLGGAEGYALVAEADRTGTSPGAALSELFRRFGPSLVLIDEWVTYARQLYHRQDLPAGSFDAQFSFAQALTEAAAAVPGTLLVISIPESDRMGTDTGPSIEVGGPGGRDALARLRTVVGRVESAWRPASSEESFEIVRRRLFEPITDPELFAARDATARAFGDQYRRQARDFPTECREESYVSRIKAAYPIHPELLDRLYQDWSTLERFQRTRGVLRLMAIAIHALWVQNDQSPLMLSSSLPLDNTECLTELTRPLEDNWKPIIDSDVDGPSSTPARVDQENPRLGQYTAARRAARAVFLGSAPLHGTPNRGLDEVRVRLACSYPGDPVEVFSDALRRLSNQSTYLYVDSHRYWFDTQPSISRTAADRASRYLEQQRDDLLLQITERLQKDSTGRQQRGEFGAVHVVPSSTNEVPDESESVRLVILGPDVSHTSKGSESRALQEAQRILELRGNASRIYRNLLIFLAADTARSEELMSAVAEYLAWMSLKKQVKELNLAPFNEAQIETKLESSNRDVQLRLGETYNWLLVPEQPDPQGAVKIATIRVTGDGTLAERASRKIVDNQLLNRVFSPVLLRLALDRIPLWKGNHLTAGELWDHLARYLYLPRLASREVLYEAVESGPQQLLWDEEGFALAESYDERAQRYLGLRGPGTQPAQQLAVTAGTLLVRPGAAKDQLAHDAAEQPGATPGTSAAGATSSSASTGTQGPAPAAPAPPAPRRFHATAKLNPLRISSDAAQIAEEIVQRLAGVVDTEVKVTVEIEARTPEGFPSDVVRAVSENGQTLKLDSFGFEEQ